MTRFLRLSWPARKPACIWCNGGYLLIRHEGKRIHELPEPGGMHLCAKQDKWPIRAARHLARIARLHWSGRFLRLCVLAIFGLMGIGASFIVYGGHIAEAYIYAQQVEAKR